MKCPDCGTEMEYGWECVDPEVVIMVCPNCGKHVAV